jgi:succinate dehydrogenase hydrophobic anchor subunit
MIKVLSTAIIVAMIILFAQVYMTTEAKKETEIYKAKCDSLQYVTDSLYDELFIKHIENGRYELTLDYLQEVNTKAALQFLNYMKCYFELLY